MFHNIPKPILERLRYLEAIDARDRLDGTPVSHRLRQIPPETGRLLALLAAAAPDGDFLEIGASGGYSSLWISLALLERGGQLVTFDVLEHKVRLAEETFRAAGVESLVRVVHGQALDHLDDFRQVAFCFLDIEKDLYLPCYEKVVPNLVPGGLFLADNLISHARELENFQGRVQADERIDALLIPIGKGVLVCRRPARR
jgi:predicted O-methyltransferase YrrM